MPAASPLLAAAESEATGAGGGGGRATAVAAEGVPGAAASFAELGLSAGRGAAIEAAAPLAEAWCETNGTVEAASGLPMRARSRLQLEDPLATGNVVSAADPLEAGTLGFLAAEGGGPPGCGVAFLFDPTVSDAFSMTNSTDDKF